VSRDLTSLSDTPGTPPPGGAERSYMVDMQTLTFRSYTGRTGQLALAACRGAYRLQDRHTDIQGSAWDITGVSGPVVCVADLPGRPAVRSAGTNCLVVPLFKRSTIGTRAFRVAGPEAWNSGRHYNGTVAVDFRQSLNTHLFIRLFLYFN